MRSAAWLFLFLAAAAAAASVWAAAPDAWSSLQFLLGDWDAVAKPGEPAGWSSFTSEAGGRVIVRRNHAEYPASQGRPAGVHDDLLVIYREGDPAAVRAIYFDNEKHVIHYALEAAADGRAVFVSEAAPNAARFRLSYTKLPDGRLSGKFEIAPPGKPDAFGTYLEWVAQKRDAGHGAPPPRD